MASSTPRPQAGDAVEIVSKSGELMAVASVTEIVDPFTEANMSQLCCGIRLISFEVQVRAETDGVSVNPASFKVVKDIGWAGVTAHEKRSDSRTELTYKTLKKGEDVRGSITIAMEPGVAMTRIIWVTDDGNIHTLAQFSPLIELGTRQVLGTGFDETIFAFTAVAVADPYLDVRQSSAPPQGYRYVGAAILIENIGQGSMSMEPNRFVLISSTGQKYARYQNFVRLNAARADVPNLNEDSFAVGDSRIGFVGFMVPEDIELASLVYYDGNSGAFLTLWDYAG